MAAFMVRTMKRVLFQEARALGGWGCRREEARRRGGATEAAKERRPSAPSSKDRLLAVLGDRLCVNSLLDTAENYKEKKPACVRSKEGSPQNP
jgi:hypothetical protein